MSTKRTQEEILARLKTLAKSDLFGFQSNDLIEFLSFENAKSFIREGVTANEWLQETDSVKLIKEYIGFAWRKANDRRGLSAGRSMEHMKAWLWLDGKDELVEKMESDYAYYGKPCLRLICNEYGIDWQAMDDGEWVNSEHGAPLTAEEALK